MEVELYCENNLIGFVDFEGFDRTLVTLVM